MLWQGRCIPLQAARHPNPSVREESRSWPGRVAEGCSFAASSRGRTADRESHGGRGESRTGLKPHTAHPSPPLALGGSHLFPRIPTHSHAPLPPPPLPALQTRPPPAPPLASAAGPGERTSQPGNSTSSGHRFQARRADWLLRLASHAWRGRDPRGIT